jgi:hypothetical protein
MLGLVNTESKGKREMKKGGKRRKEKSARDPFVNHIRLASKVVSFCYISYKKIVPLPSKVDTTLHKL